MGSTATEVTDGGCCCSPPVCHVCPPPGDFGDTVHATLSGFGFPELNTTWALTDADGSRVWVVNYSQSKPVTGGLADTETDDIEIVLNCGLSGIVLGVPTVPVLGVSYTVSYSLNGQAVGGGGRWGWSSYCPALVSTPPPTGNAPPVVACDPPSVVFDPVYQTEEPGFAGMCSDSGGQALVTI